MHKVTFYAEHIIANCSKLTVSAQNKTSKGLFKNLYTNMY